MDFSTIVYAQAASEVTEFRMRVVYTSGGVSDLTYSLGQKANFLSAIKPNGGTLNSLVSILVEAPVGWLSGSDCVNLFYHTSYGGYNVCTELDISNLDVSLCTDFTGCFRGVKALGSIDLTPFSEAKPTNLSYFLGENNALVTIIGLEKIDVSSVTRFDNTFRQVPATSFMIGGWQASPVPNFGLQRTFIYTQTTSIDLSGFNLDLLTSSTPFTTCFYSTPNLLTVYCRTQEDANKLQQWGGAAASVQFIVGKPPQQDLIFDPQEVNLGLLTTPTTYTLTIENGFAQTITADVIRQNYSGVLDSLGDTVTLQAGKTIDVLVDVSMSGSFNLNARLMLDVPSIGRAFIHYITGQRGLVISFKPDQGLTEKWQWKTEVLTDYNYNEDRLALRTVPRMTFNAPYTLKQGADATQMERILYEGYSIKSILPRFELQASARVDSTTIFCDTAYGGWQADMTGIAWKNSQEFEFFEVYEVTSDFLTVKSEFTQDMTSCLVMPANAVNMTGSPTRSDGQGMYSKFSVDFYAEAPPHWDIPDPSQEYEGVELCDMRLPVAKGGTMQRTYEVPSVIMDNGLSKPFYAHVRPVATQSYQVSMPCNSLDDIIYWREFLLRRQGVIRPFWASSKRHDIKILEPVTSSQDSIIVEGGNTGLTPPDKSPRALVMLQLNDGTTVYRKIRTFTALDGKQEIRFTTSLGVNANPEDFKRVSFFSQFRLSSDDVEWKWTKTWKATVSFAVQELYV